MGGGRRVFLVNGLEKTVGDKRKRESSTAVTVSSVAELFQHWLSRVDRQADTAATRNDGTRGRDETAIAAELAAFTGASSIGMLAADGGGVADDTSPGKAVRLAASMASAAGITLVQATSSAQTAPAGIGARSASVASGLASSTDTATVQPSPAGPAAAASQRAVNVARNALSLVRAATPSAAAGRDVVCRTPVAALRRHAVHVQQVRQQEGQQVGTTDACLVQLSSAPGRCFAVVGPCCVDADARLPGLLDPFFAVRTALAVHGFCFNHGAFRVAFGMAQLSSVGGAPASHERRRRLILDVELLAAGGQDEDDDDTRTDEAVDLRIGQFLSSIAHFDLERVSAPRIGSNRTAATAVLQYCAALRAEGLLAPP